MDLRTEFGPIDIYLFDQLLKGRIPPGSKVFDAGCGGGRNLIYFLRQGYEVFGVDNDPYAIEHLKKWVQQTRPDLDLNNFRSEAIESNSFEDQSFDTVILNAVLHFAQSEKEFLSILQGAWRVLKVGGLFFCRLTSDIGIESRVQLIQEKVYALPDGSTRYLVNQDDLLSLGEQLNGQLVDPIKTTNVQNQRCMTTWVLLKQ